MGLLICDRRDKELQSTEQLRETMWRQRKIENYLRQLETLVLFAIDAGAENAMRDTIEELFPPIAPKHRSLAWWRNTKKSDDFLDPLFECLYERFHIPNLMRKSNYHCLAPYVPRELLDAEVSEKLDRVVEQAAKAQPTRA